MRREVGLRPEDPDEAVVLAEGLSVFVKFGSEPPLVVRHQLLSRADFQSAEVVVGTVHREGLDLDRIRRVEGLEHLAGLPDRS